MNKRPFFIIPILLLVLFLPPLFFLAEIGHEAQTAPRCPECMERVEKYARKCPACLSTFTKPTSREEREGG